MAMMRDEMLAEANCLQVASVGELRCGTAPLRAYTLTYHGRCELSGTPSCTSGPDFIYFVQQLNSLSTTT